MFFEQTANDIKDRRETFGCWSGADLALELTGNDNTERYTKTDRLSHELTGVPAWVVKNIWAEAAGECKKPEPQKTSPDETSLHQREQQEKALYEKALTDNSPASVLARRI